MEDRMPYTTVTRVKQALAPDGQDQANPASNYRGTAASLGDNAIEDAIAEAQTTIDTYIGARYDVPVTAGFTPDPDGTLVAPEPVAMWARTIAAYFATLTFNRNAPIDANHPAQLRYNAVLAQLTAVRDNKISLDLPAVTGTTTSSVAVGVNQYEGTLFFPEDVLTATHGDPWPASQRGRSVNPYGWPY